MKYRTLVVDDNRVARLMLTSFLKKIDSIELVDSTEDAPSTIAVLKKEQIDILFLDVEMPGMSGIELLRILPERPLTILVTAKPGYAAEAFELNVVDYLVKPFSLARVIMAVERAAELLFVRNSKLNRVAENHLFIKEGKAIRKITLDQILWLEAKGDYVKIKMQDSSFIIHSTLKNIEDKLSNAEFVRIHRGYMIPVKRIDSIEDGAVYIQGFTLPLSDNYKTNLLDCLHML